MAFLRPGFLPPSLQSAISHRELGAGQTLYRRGDVSEAIFMVERGRLTLSSYTTEGKPVPLYVIRPGECVSEAALFADHYCGDVIAEIPSRVTMYPKRPLLEIFQANPELAAAFMERLSKRFNLLRVRLELRSLQSARARILQYLIFAASPGQSAITLDRPLKSIADDLGLSHESFYRTMSAMIKDGTIKRTKNTITLLDRYAARNANCC